MLNIQQISNAAYGVQAYPPVKGNAKKEAPNKTSVAGNEQVELSDASLNLKKLKDIVDAFPDVRIKLVEDIQQKIKYNGYPFETNIYKAIEKLIENNIV